MYCRSLGETSLSFGALLCPLGDLSQRFCDFTYEIAFATGCAICPDVIPPLILEVCPGGLTKAVRESARVVRISSGFAVRNALAESYGVWRNRLVQAARDLNDAVRDLEDGV